MMMYPLITCIMPTANRKEFMLSAIDDFLNQDYPNAELIIVDDGIEDCSSIIPSNSKIKYFDSEPLGSVGRKRNIACEQSSGEFIVHWDDDDWYASDWVSRHACALLDSGADITGLNCVRMYESALKQNYIYDDDDEKYPWLCGATLAFRKSLWQKYNFADLQIGEDYDFLRNSGGKIFAFDYINGFTANLHENNIGIKHINIHSIIIKELINLDK